jgi:hypothetical protein|tara:strand:+ start:452 stop:1480 length:1029 start_codon:yes stop_codon:yes gene_type:complete
VDKKNENNRLINVENEMIGKYLSMEINREKVDTECPSQERLAAFLDDKLGDADRNALVGHISSCSDCHELLTEVIGMQEEEGVEECPEVLSETVTVQEEPQWNSWFSARAILLRYVPYSLAAAAAVFLIMLYVSRDTEIEKLSFVKERVAALADDIGDDSVPSLFGNGPSYYFGFAGTYSANGAAFRTGVCLTDIRIEAMAENKEEVSILLGSITGLLKSMKASDRTIQACEGIKIEVDKGESLRESAAMADEAVFIETDEPLFVRFGQWCEGGRVAAVIRTEDYYNINDVRRFVSVLEREGLPLGISRSLSDIESIVDAGVFTGVEFRVLEKEFENLISLF